MSRIQRLKEGRVREIIELVKAEGDRAVKFLTKKFDGIDIEQTEINKEVSGSSSNQVNRQLKDAIAAAVINIERFHVAQLPKGIEVDTVPGVRCKLVYRPLKRVGLYVPGGTAPLISTALMLGIPARVAGCSELIVCTPPPVNPAILYVSSLLNARVFRIGGAQAIAAMAFGTQTIPQVNKIFGPGNAYVTEAKMQIAAAGIPIDIPAGPSELLVISDETAIPKFIAADLLSQAEHCPDSQVVLISTSTAIINETLNEINIQMEKLSRKLTAQKSLGNSFAIKVDSIPRVIEISNTYAPEHLIMAIENPNEFENEIVNAGSVFLGNFTPESVGDYASGTNHTLPTSGFAKSWSGVSLNSFLKTITLQELTPSGLYNISSTVTTLANAERLDAHANAISIRLNYINNRSKNEIL